MNFQEAEKYLNENFVSFQTAGRTAYREGLDTIESMCRLLGNPQNDYMTIHIAGTNGKGSVSHMLASVLQASGRRTGLYTSPHLATFRERIRIDGELISETGVAEFMTLYGEDMKRLGMSYFEMTTAMAFWWFAREGVDAAVIETGLGGRLDATNVVKPVVSVVTNVSIDHSDILGNTRAAIAAEKAGIIKVGVPVVVGRSCSETDVVFIDKAAAAGAELTFADRTHTAAEQPSSHTAKCYTLTDLHDGSTMNVEIDLCGDYQRENVVTVRTVVDVLRRSDVEISDAALLDGLHYAARTTGLRGRWEVLSESPLTVVDGGHNPDAVGVIVRQLANIRYDRLFMVLGFSADKDTDKILEMLPRDAYYIFTQASSSRAMSAAELSQRAAACGLHGQTADTPSLALALARRLAAPHDMIFVGGSLYIAAEIC